MKGFLSWPRPTCGPARVGFVETGLNLISDRGHALRIGPGAD